MLPPCYLQLDLPKHHDVIRNVSSFLCRAGMSMCTSFLGSSIRHGGMETRIINKSRRLENEIDKAQGSFQNLPAPL